MSNQTSKLQNALKDTFVVGQTSQGLEVRGTLLKFTRFAVVFEIYSPIAVLRTSEVLQRFKLVLDSRTLYSGDAVVRNVISTGPAVVVCEVTLKENSWSDLDVTAINGHPGNWRDEYRTFLADWQKSYRVRPEYKLVLADMQTYFSDLRLWLDQVELGLRTLPAADRQAIEQQLAAELGIQTKATLEMFFERFEEAARFAEKDSLPAYHLLARRQLHPLLLCSPFFHRCFAKPLGYAGDYEMVNMMLRNPAEGSSLFAKVMNIWFLAQPPVVAHRNRIDYLDDHLVQFTARMASRGKPTRILNLGCGPAQEVQRFLANHEISTRAEFTLLDFNDETLRFTAGLMDGLKRKHGRQTKFQYVKKSVHNLIKEGSRSIKLPEQNQYDLAYCAGLFDYLSDTVCQRLMSIMYDWLAPGGLLLATNVHACNPSIGWMEHMVDWHLLYRNAGQMAALIPKQAPPDNARIIAEPTGVNVFVEITKPEND